jgi:hypothetical protein
MLWNTRTIKESGYSKEFEACTADYIIITSIAA